MKKKLESILRTPDIEKCGYWLDSDLEYPSKIHENQTRFHFVQKKNIKVEVSSFYMI